MPNPKSKGSPSYVGRSATLNSPSKGMREAIVRLSGLDGTRWRLFTDPRRHLLARTLEDVPEVIAEAEREALAGRMSVGYVTFEAAPAFDPRLPARPPDPTFPLAEFLVFDRFQDAGSLPPRFSGPPPVLEWRPELTRESYESSIRRIRRYIETGDTYQVNFTYRLTSQDEGDPRAVFRAMAACRLTRHSAFVDTGTVCICSASPELYFELDGEVVRSRPMKGTAPRGRFSAEDDRVAEMLRSSSKDRAENLMIVDMVRSDLGRIAFPGSVRVESLFDIERFSTVHQMTSTVSARTWATVLDVFRATFPPASVTGAPKRRTLEIIQELESSPRGIYTGCVGTIGPGRRAHFNVAIRTAVLVRDERRWVYGIGSGIVWDSDPGREFIECTQKSAILNPPEEHDLIETILWTKEKGFCRLRRHLDRMAASARYFGFAEMKADPIAVLDSAVRNNQSDPLAVKLRMKEDGALSAEARPVEPWPTDRPALVAISDRRVESSDRMLYHKTTLREAFELAKRAHPDCDEVLFLNENGFVTQGTISNIAVQLERRLVTPPVTHGLLPGVLRQEMLERGELVEGEVRLEDLLAASEFYVLNSVRGMARATLRLGRASEPALDGRTSSIAL